MKIVISEGLGFSKDAISTLQRCGTVTVMESALREDLISELKDADAVFVRLAHKIDSEILNAAPNLKYILTATTGTDHIDEKHFSWRNGSVISLKNEFAFLETIPSTAEFTFGLLLALMRKIPWAIDHVKQGDWNRDLFKGNNLSGKKIGILGMGRVGAQVAKYAGCFGMEVGYHDIIPKTAQGKCFASAAELFNWADIISIHIPLNDSTNGLIDDRLLKHVKPSAIIINTSRGAILDEDCLANKIENRHIAGFACDVIRDEIQGNVRGNKFVELSKRGFPVIVTPHIAGATFESMQQTEDFIAQKFLETVKPARST